MRTRWLPGSATGLGGNYPGRYITPWREDEEPISPTRYPFKSMTTKQFVAMVWGVYSWQVNWTAKFNGPLYSLATGGTFEMLPYPTNPPAGQEAPLLITEEHRMGAGFQHRHTQPVPVAYAGAQSDVTCFLGGKHRYTAPGETQQRFTPFVTFIYALDLAPGGTAPESAQWGVINPEAPTDSIGTGTLQMISATLGRFPDYDSDAKMIVNVSPTSVLIGPATVSATLSITPLKWWPFTNADGIDPIWLVESGGQLRSTNAPPSAEPVGDAVTSLPGTRFVA